MERKNTDIMKIGIKRKEKYRYNENRDKKKGKIQI